MPSRLRPLTLAVVLGLGGGCAAAAETALPRKSPPESYPGVVVLYDSVTDAAGHRLRLILTHPQERAPQPVIFVAGWLSCDTVEAPAGDRGAAQQVFQALAALPARAAMLTMAGGIVAFFLLEKWVLWRHCHDDEACHVHSTAAKLVIVGDTFHTFVDGAVIAGAVVYG